MQEETLKEVKFFKAEDGSLWICEPIQGQWRPVRQIKYILEAQAIDEDITEKVS